MKNTYQLLYLLVVISITITSCKQKHPKIEYYSNGNLKSITVSENEFSKNIAVYSFAESGEIKEIRRYNKNNHEDGEQLYFFANGKLDRKLPVVNSIAKGNAYYFYESNGALKNFRFFRNNKESLYGGDYWGDSMDIMKASLHFNDKGEIFYKKNFDRNGLLVSEEGKK